MIADELKILFDDLKNDIMLLRTDMTLINHDIIKIREQLDRIEMISSVINEEPIGIAPGTPPASFVPSEYK